MLKTSSQLSPIQLLGKAEIKNLSITTAKFKHKFSESRYKNLIFKDFSQNNSSLQSNKGAVCFYGLRLHWVLPMPNPQFGRSYWHFIHTNVLNISIMINFCSNSHRIYSFSLKYSHSCSQHKQSPSNDECPV